MIYTCVRIYLFGNARGYFMVSSLAGWSHSRAVFLRSGSLAVSPDLVNLAHETTIAQDTA
jgi:hypothetical protein